MEEIEHLKARVKCNNCGYDLDVCAACPHGDYCEINHDCCDVMQKVGNALEELAALVQAESEGRIIPKEAHQPSFVKYDAIDIFDQWNDTTGVLGKGTSWYCEIQGVIEEVAAMAFGAGVIYQSEASAAQAAKEEQG